jgi:hypothetical protein
MTRSAGGKKFKAHIRIRPKLKSIVPDQSPDDARSSNRATC